MRSSHIAPYAKAKPQLGAVVHDQDPSQLIDAPWLANDTDTLIRDKLECLETSTYTEAAPTRTSASV